MEKIHFALNCDKKYIKPTAMAIVSVLEKLDTNYSATFHILCSGFRNKPKIYKIIENKFKCTISIINVDKYAQLFKNQSQNKFQLSYISIATYYRLLIFKIIQDADIIFYIDSDMIVNYDLSILYKNFPRSKLFGAVVEIQATKYKHIILAHTIRIKDFEKMHANYNEAPYFNAGFFIANLKLARELKCFDDILNFLSRYPNPLYADQDTLNAVFGQKYNKLMYYLDPSYNVFCNIDYSGFDRKTFYDNDVIYNAFLHPKIIHYAGSEKPWFSSRIKYFQNEWWECASHNKYIKFKRKKYTYNVYKFLGLIPFYFEKINN